MVAQNRYLLGVQSLLILAALFWYLYPAMTFGGKYSHERSESRYEFQNGRFLENGKDLGSYSVHLRWVRMTLEFSDNDTTYYGKIGWNSVTMPIPKYGQAERLTRTEL